MSIRFDKSTLAFSIFLFSALMLTILIQRHPGQETWSALVLVLVTIGFLATGLIPEYLTALVFFTSTISCTTFRFSALSRPVSW